MEDLNLPKKRKFLNQASVLKRAAAFLIDLLIIRLIIIQPFSSAILNRFPVEMDFAEYMEYFSANNIQDLYIISFIIFVMIILYFVIFEYKFFQTPGKMLFKLRIVSATKNQKIGLLNIVARSLALIPIFPFWLLWIIDPLYLIFTGNRLSDLFSKTRVVEEITA